MLTTYQLLFFVPYGWPVHEQFLKDIGYQPPVKSCRIILGSIAKIFAGELVEEARDIMKAKGEAGPIQPRHLVGSAGVTAAKRSHAHDRASNSR